jgi:hypothetical protein
MLFPADSAFVTLVLAHVVSKRWSVLTRATLYSVMLILTLGSLAIYGDVALGPPGAKTAFVFVVVPPASWLLIAIVVSNGRANIWHVEEGQMISGAHVIVYSKNAEADRAFFGDVLGFKSVDAGHGWLIFALPPAEAAFHPSETMSTNSISCATI